MAITEMTDALTRIPPFTLVVVLILGGFALAGYALYVGGGRR